MNKNKKTDPQLENINKLLDVFIDKFSIAASEKDLNKKRQIAFELLSCVCAFNVSPFYAKDNCWTAIKKEKGKVPPSFPFSFFMIYDAILKITISGDIQ